MTPATAKTLPAAALCEMLLRRNPGCAWLLRRDGAFQAVYGDALRVFGRSAPGLEDLNFTDLFAPPARPAWSGRLERVFRGETAGASGRFSDVSSTFFISLFPVQQPEGEVFLAGGIAHDLAEGDIFLRTLESLESERTRLSQIVHDRFGQSLNAAGLQLDLLRMDLAETGLPISPRIGEIQAMLETAMGLARDVYRELNPATAERVGLRAALDRLAGRLRTDFKGNVRVYADATARPSPEAAAALFRIAQEAAGQAARRPGCSAIEILLKSLRSGPALEIRDNGPPGKGEGTGFQGEGRELLAMQHFADRADIELQIDSVPHKGTVVRASCRPANRLDG